MSGLKWKLWIPAENDDIIYELLSMAMPYNVLDDVLTNANANISGKILIPTPTAFSAACKILRIYIVK